MTGAENCHHVACIARFVEESVVQQQNIATHWKQKYISVLPRKAPLPWSLEHPVHRKSATMFLGHEGQDVRQRIESFLKRQRGT